ncbi:MAG: GC-type dockerin domain-anchored protein [Phycisphaerales bacterium]
MSTFARGIIVLALTGAAHGQAWTALGPAPLSGFGGATGRVSALATSLTDASTVYVGGADGGVWRTSDAGATWTPLTDQAATTAIGALALEPGNEQIIYAGTGEANFANHSRYGLGLLKSIDGGATWALLARETFGGRCFSRIVIDPVSPNRLYASVTRAGGFPELAAAKGHPGALGPRGVFASSDGGATWSLLGGGLPSLDATDLVMDPIDPATMYAAIGRIFGNAANGIYKTTDRGASWVRLGDGLPTAGVGRISLAVAPSNRNRLYALVTAASDATGGGATVLGGFRSDNAGATWFAVPVPSIQSTYGWYLSVVAVSPTNADVVWMGGLSMVRSDNTGATWLTVTPPHVDVHALAFDAAGRLWCGNDGGVHRTSNGGGAWQGFNAGLGTAQFYAGISIHPTDANYVIGGLQDNGSVRRTTASLTWGSFLGGDGGWTQLDPRAPSTVWAEFQGTGNLYRSTNGGVSTSAMGIGLAGRNCFLPPYLIHPTDSSIMYYATERVYRSTDGGAAWLPLSPDLTGGGSAAIRALAISPSEPSRLYAATNDGRFLASSDGGATFALRLSGLPGWPRVTREIEVDPRDGRTVYLAGAGFGVSQVRRSTDAGQTWDVLDGDLPDLPVNVVAVDSLGPAPILYAGTDAGLYRSVDEGLRWRRYGSGLPRAAVIDVRIDVARSRVVLATQGRGAWAAAHRACYADMDDDGSLTVNDFVEFVNAVAAGQARANCDQSTTPPTLNVVDFVCFLNAFAAGCG